MLHNDILVSWYKFRFVLDLDWNDKNWIDDPKYDFEWIINPIHQIELRSSYILATRLNNLTDDLY